MGITIGKCWATKEDMSDGSQRNIEGQLEANRRWIEALEKQVDNKIRELSMRSADVEVERAKNSDLMAKLVHLERETEILKAMLKKSEKEEERLRMELLGAYNELRSYRKNLHQATDQLKSHVTQKEEVTTEEQVTTV